LEAAVQWVCKGERGGSERGRGDGDRGSGGERDRGEVAIEEGQESESEELDVWLASGQVGAERYGEGERA